MTKNEVVILAGGFGTRLKDIIGEKTPKPMVEINSKPLLEWQIELCRNNGFKNILILVHHLAEKIIDYFGTGEDFGVNIEYSIENTPRGTAGAIYDSLEKLSKEFLVIYGDTFLDVNLRKFFASKKSQDSVLTFCHPNSHPYDSDLLELDDSGQVIRVFRPIDGNASLYKNLVNAALYVCDKNIFSDFVDSQYPMDISSELFPKLIKNNKTIRAYKSPEYIKDIGSPERLTNTKTAIKNKVPNLLSDKGKRRCIFLDRDGVINKEVGHLSDTNSFEILPNVCEAIKIVNESGYLAICVTNQPVVARGDISIQKLEEIHMKMEVELGKAGAYLDDIFYCPHHPDSGFLGEISELKIICDCRKPKPGMLLNAIKSYEIDPLYSWMIGDNQRDIQAGIAAKVKTIYLGNNENLDDFGATHKETNLLEAVSLIFN